MSESLEESAYQRAMREQLEEARLYNQTKDSTRPTNPVDSAEKDGTTEMAKKVLLQDKGSCGASCTCLEQQGDPRKCETGERSRIGKLAAIETVIGHRIHNDKVFLLCKRVGTASAPEYIRACQVSNTLRKAYLERTVNLSEITNLSEFWTVQDEQNLRAGLYPPLSAVESRYQSEIAQCSDTNEWNERTGSGMYPM